LGGACQQHYRSRNARVRQRKLNQGGTGGNGGIRFGTLAQQAQR
jgi:hypothetical protein